VEESGHGLIWLEGLGNLQKSSVRIVSVPFRFEPIISQMVISETQLPELICSVRFILVRILMSLFPNHGHQATPIPSARHKKETQCVTCFLSPYFCTTGHLPKVAHFYPKDGGSTFLRK
jgi:hypothetical protein